MIPCRSSGLVVRPRKNHVLAAPSPRFGLFRVGHDHAAAPRPGMRLRRPPAGRRPPACGASWSAGNCRTCSVPSLRTASSFEISPSSAKATAARTAACGERLATRVCSSHSRPDSTVNSMSWMSRASASSSRRGTHQFGVHARHLLAQRIQRHWRVVTRDHVLALAARQPLAPCGRLAGDRVAAEQHAGTRTLVEIAEHHRLDRHRSTAVVGQAAVAADRPGRVASATNRTPQPLRRVTAPRDRQARGRRGRLARPCGIARRSGGAYRRRSAHRRFRQRVPPRLRR